MLNKFGFYLLFILPFSLEIYGQPKHPAYKFQSPLDIPLFLSGSFGELRNNHFHAGVDLKTAGVQGKRVYSITDGYISRIKVSAAGYGKALYISHPDGYMSVYSHLKKFSPQIDAFVKDAQYQKQSFEIDLYPGSQILPVKAGDLIAFSGNSGGSQAPHLHLEIRDAKTEYALNPLLFGFDITDNTPPRIIAISIYPLDKHSMVNDVHQTKYVSLSNLGNGEYRLRGNPVYILQGSIGFGINAYDNTDDQFNKNGVYSVELKKDDTTVFSYELNTFGFYQTRYINCHIDYEKKLRTGLNYQKCYLADGNKLEIYKNLVNNGKINFNDDSIHHIEFIVKDIYGNTSNLKFDVQSSSSAIITNTDPVPFLASNGHDVDKNKYLFFPAEHNYFNTDDIILDIPPYTFYDTLNLKYSSSISQKNDHYSLIHKVHDDYTPVHNYYTISIKPTDSSEHLRNKMVIVNIRNGGKYSEGGNWSNGYVSTKTRSLGNFVVMVDTTAPSISSLNIYNNKNMSKSSQILIRVNDNLSGIKSYNAYIDGKWVLMEHDAKNNLLAHYFDERTLPGTHQFFLVVADEKGNKNELFAEFVR